MPPPIPVCRSIILCQGILQDQRTQTTSLIGLVGHIRGLQFPTVGQFSIFSRWANGHGDYHIEAQLRDAEGNVAWKQAFPQPCAMPDPLTPCDLSFHDLKVFIPGPGRYDLVLIANGEEVGRETLMVHIVQTVG